VNVDAVIVAAGASTRFGQDKLLAELCGRTVLARSVEAFASSEMVRGIVVVAAEERKEEFAEAVRAAPARSCEGWWQAVSEGGIASRRGCVPPRAGTWRSTMGHGRW
jgi:CTP:molybdopterin cytidylyltransferase MocA